MNEKTITADAQANRLTRRDLLLGAAGAQLCRACAALASLGAASAPRQAVSGFAGQFGRRPAKAPELIGGPEDWLNTDGTALRLYGKGGLLQSDTVRAIVVDFWEYTCVNCIRTMPYLAEWHRRYADKGLTIIGIHTPEFEFGKSKENVAAAAERFGLRYPLVNDAKMANWEAWGNVYWPRKYLVDSRGRVVYDHAGEGGYGETEAQIQRLLRAGRPRIELPPLMEPVRGADKPGAVCYPQTREIYAGYWRGDEYFASKEGLRRDIAFDYTDPGGRRGNGVFYAQGRWQVNRENIRHARETPDDPFTDYIVVPYMALEVNAVIKPEDGRTFDIYIMQDGKPLAKEDKGVDVTYAADGRSLVRVREPRMYSLVKNAKWGRHELLLGTTSPGFGLYSFTFSSCEVGGNS